jgi:hypothetical protein
MDAARTLILDELGGYCDREYYFCTSPSTEPWFECVESPNNGWSKLSVMKYSLTNARPEWIRLAREMGLLDDWELGLGVWQQSV